MDSHSLCRAINEESSEVIELQNNKILYEDDALNEVGSLVGIHQSNEKEDVQYTYIDDKEEANECIELKQWHNSNNETGNSKNSKETENTKARLKILNGDVERNFCARMKPSKNRRRFCIGTTISLLIATLIAVVTLASSGMLSGGYPEDITPLKQLLVRLKHPELYETFKREKINANQVRNLNANHLTEIGVDSETAQMFLQVVDEENNLKQLLMEMNMTNFLDILWKNDVRTENLMVLDIDQLTTFGLTIGERISFMDKVKAFLKTPLKDLKTDILTAAENGDIEGVKRTLKKANELNVYKQILNSQNEKGWSVLFTAIYNYKKDVTHLLLDLGCEVNTSTNEKHLFEGSTPLMEASYRGWTDIVKKLIENGAVVNAFTTNKGDAAFLATHEGHLETLKLLLDKDSSAADRKGYLGRTTLGWAAFKGHLNIVKYLIQNYNPRLNTQEINNDTPLTLAASFNHPQVVQYLLHKGADKSIKGRSGKTALKQASEKNNIEVIKIFKEYVEQ